MSLIQVQNLTFAYEGSYDNVFDNASLRLDTRWKLGLVGRNGRGKTTLLRLLMGELPYQGTITAPVDFAYFPPAVADPQPTGGAVAAAAASQAEPWQLRREMFLLGLEEELLDRPWSTLSPGEQTKLLLAALFCGEDRFLLIDEPTNHLDRQGRALVGEYLNGKRGFILISHDRAFLDSCIDHVLSINKATITVTKGNFSVWQHNKELQDQFEQEQDQRLRQEIHRLEQTVREKAAWADQAEQRKIGFDPRCTEKNINRRPQQGAKSKKLMQRSAALRQRQEHALEEKSRLLADVESTFPLKMHPLTYHSRRLVELDHVTIRYGEKAVCQDQSWVLEQGERLALTGPNGCGKSTLLRLIAGVGLAGEYQGTLRRGSGLRICYLPQDTSWLKGRPGELARHWGLDETLFKTNLRQLDFSRTHLDKPAEALSAGQRKKLLLAAGLSQEAHLYLWDEPLNYIDVISRMQVEELLLQYQPTMIFVEHDAAFCQRVATRLLDLG